MSHSIQVAACVMLMGLASVVGVRGGEETEVGGGYLLRAVEFADCMLEHGRDRYGSVHTPLFAVLLTRGPAPGIGPAPVFASPAKYEWQKRLESPFREFDYNRCLNYPAGLGAEGPHKVTMHGCDPYEDADLYRMLIDLSRITGDPKYAAEAGKALRWWFENTMGAAGLYPWGEHMGWDFENECPSYFAGPSKHLYGACFHEIKDEVPFLDLLASLPVREGESLTPLERYALGIWDAHYWDQERAIYCRHGDYTGEDDRRGSLAGFPAHQGAHLRLWVKALMTSANADVRSRMVVILNKVLDVQIERAEKHGFIPFTFDTDVNGKTPKESGQSDRLGRHAAELSPVLAGEHPEIAGKLGRLAAALGCSGPAAAGGRKVPAEVADLSGVRTPGRHAGEIIRRLELHGERGDPAYLVAAELQARAARAMFCDDSCPLPRAYSDGPRKTPEGGDFPDFYFRGARLMHAFALLGERLDRRQ